MERYNLPNRDGDKVWLEKYDTNLYVLKTNNDYPFGVTKNGDNIVAVDPSGGPYICIGFQVENKVVTGIKFVESVGFVFKLMPFKEK